MIKAILLKFKLINKIKNFNNIKIIYNINIKLFIYIIYNGKN